MTGDDDLSKRIEAARKAQKPEEKPGTSSATSSALAKALGFSFGFLAAVGLGGLIGHTIDRLAGTGPWGLLIFLVFGIAAGFLNIFREAKKMAEDAARSQGPDEDPGGE
ncbi:MAG: F0F1 ATP synthase assembly protein I [Alphaproteobacteria bacterium]|jgi:ATP synthase protein I|nr:F0F1 ATP synthase assembly protein I [Alphaproteobacteria bacterium]